MSSIIWDKFKTATCMPDNCFCEAVHLESLIRQPANTWSNLGFVLVAVIILYLYQKNRGSSYVTQSAHYPVLFTLSCFVVGVGSLFYHASLTFMGQWLDNIGMYLVVSLIAIYNIDRLFKLGTDKALLLFVLANIAFAAMAYYIPETRRFLFAGVIVFFACTEVLARIRLPKDYQNKYLIFAALAFALAFAVWIPDSNKTLCDPHSLWQGHALWHLLGALAAFNLYQYLAKREDKTEL